jgi:mannose-6-phosphate isomerase-like protein (cupin superfamily)
MKLIKIYELNDQRSSHNEQIRKKEILANGEVGSIVNYARATFPPGEVAGMHSHADMTEVFTVESGCGEIRINDVAYVFSSGMTFVVEPGEAHEITNTGSADLIVTYFGVKVSTC